MKPAATTHLGIDRMMNKFSPSAFIDAHVLISTSIVHAVMARVRNVY
jgi:hypothetical protein